MLHVGGFDIKILLVEQAPMFKEVLFVEEVLVDLKVVQQLVQVFEEEVLPVSSEQTHCLNIFGDVQVLLYHFERAITVSDHNEIVKHSESERIRL